MTRRDYIVLCIDMSKKFTIGDYDGKFNSFLTQCSVFGEKGMMQRKKMEGAPCLLKKEKEKQRKGNEQKKKRQTKDRTNPELKPL